jgi:hypothetical protein
MMLESLMLLVALAAPPQAPRMRLAPAPLLALAAPPAYQPQERAVGNWRFESALGLDLPPLGALRQFAGTASTQTPRCVKLNNYWCIKRAGWNGEIASDPDGHVAFASAQEGATVAALLLRRYYVDFKRHTAREIASRWAPSRCFVATATFGISSGVSRMLPQRPIAMGAAQIGADLAPHGIFNTVRARWLATHLRGGRPLSGFRRRPSAPLTHLAATPTSAPRVFAHDSAPPPLADCSGDMIRINNYATHIAEGIAAGPDQDLHLFAADGQPTDNLAKALANMAAVEIGPLRAHPSLVAFAIAQLRAAGAQ